MDADGGIRAGFAATAKINRKGFGLDIELTLDGGGVMIGDTAQISLDIQAVLQNE
ncbi:MAG TPA: YceI family protein [Pseudonocardiaceae bacterium]|nr:YceI family protein [Pseudonocardiaceae bacterium]